MSARVQVNASRIFAVSVALAALAWTAAVARAQCTYATPASGQVYGMSTSGIVTQILGSRMQSSWVVTAVSGLAGEDWDVALYQNPAASSPCVANVLASSSYGGNFVDFVIGDGSINPHTDVYARHNRYAGSGVGRAVWRDGASALLVNGKDTNRAWGVDSLLDVWHVSLVAGTTYTLNFVPSAGLGASLLVFRNPTAGVYWAPRSSALVTLSATGTFVAPASGDYALVVANDGHAAGSYVLEVGDCSVNPLVSGVIGRREGKQAVWQFDQPVPYWTVLAAKYASIEVYSTLSGAYPMCVSGWLASSSGSGGVPNFVVGNFNSLATGRHYARTSTDPMQLWADVLWDGTPDQIIVDGAPVRRVVGNSSQTFAEVWDLYLVAGQTYRFYLETQGLAFNVYLFADPGTGSHWMNSTSAVASGGSSFSYTAAATGFHGVVVANSNIGSGRFTLAVSKAPCALPTVLTTQTPATAASPDAWYSFYPGPGNWGVVAARGSNSSDDWDIEVSGDPSGRPAPNCIGAALASSGYGAGTVDLAVYDFSATSWDYNFAHAHHVSPTTASGFVEYDGTHGELIANSTLQIVSMPAATLVHAYDAAMTAGRTYTIEFTPGAIGQSVLVFENPAIGKYVAGRAAAAASGSGNITFTASTSGIHGIVVVNDGGVAGTYRLRYGQCATATALASNIGVTAPAPYSTFSFVPLTHRWSAVGVRAGTTDWDLQVSGSLGALFPNCTGPALATSTSSALNYVDFVVGDFHHMTLGTCYASAYQYTTGSPVLAQVEWSAADASLIPNTMTLPSHATNAMSPITTYDVPLSAGTTYTFGLTHTGGANLHLLLFRNPAGGSYWAGRASAVLDLAVAAGTVTYTAPASDDYALVVVNDDGLTDTFTPSVRYCPPTVALTSGLAITVSPQAFVSFTQSTRYWAAVGVRSTSDWDIEVNRLGSGGLPGFCFSELLSTSSSGGFMDFVVGDFNVGGNPPGTYYARPFEYEPLSLPGVVEFAMGSQSLGVPAPPVTRTTNSSDVLEIWDVYMWGGSDYNLYFTHSGAADVKAVLFRNPGSVYWAPRGACVLETSRHAIYRAPASGWYGLVVANDNGLPGEYTIGVQPAGVAVDETAPPLRTALNSVSPNPARGEFAVEFALHEAAPVRIELLDLLGRRVATIKDRQHDAGHWRVAWSSASGAGAPVPPGLYCLRMQVAGRTVGEKKVVLIR